MLALRVGEDAAVANGTTGAQDAVQRVRSEVQVGSACTGIPTGCEPDIRADPALELAPEGFGAPSSEGDVGGTAATPPPSSSTSRRSRSARAILQSAPWLPSLLTCHIRVGVAPMS